MHKSTGACNARLAGVEEQGLMGERGCLLDVHVLPNDGRRLPSQLQGHRLDVLAGFLSHQSSHHTRSSEGHLSEQQPPYRGQPTQQSQLGESNHPQLWTLHLN